MQVNGLDFKGISGRSRYCQYYVFSRLIKNVYVFLADPKERRLYKFYTKALPSRHLLVKLNNKNTRAMREMGPKLTIKTPEQRQFYRSVVYLVSIEHISQLILIFLLLILIR